MSRSAPCDLRWFFFSYTFWVSDALTGPKKKLITLCVLYIVRKPWNGCCDNGGEMKNVQEITKYDLRSRWAEMMRTRWRWLAAAAVCEYIYFFTIFQPLNAMSLRYKEVGIGCSFAPMSEYERVSDVYDKSLNDESRCIAFAVQSSSSNAYIAPSSVCTWYTQQALSSQSREKAAKRAMILTQFQLQ